MFVYMYLCVCVYLDGAIETSQGAMIPTVSEPTGTWLTGEGCVVGGDGGMWEMITGCRRQGSSRSWKTWKILEFDN